MGTFADDLLRPELVDDFYDQANLGLEGEQEYVFLGNFDELQLHAKQAGDRWIEAVSYYMAQHTGKKADSDQTAQTEQTQQTEQTEQTDGTGDNTAAVDPADSEVSQIGLLLSTSVGLQKINMLFNVLKGIIEATAAKAVEVAQSIANAARGR